MPSEQFDVVVIGMGPGGEEVAERLAEAGLRVAAAERELVGGECPYWGCIPSKGIIRCADAVAEARRIPGLAGTASVSPDWSPVAVRVRELVSNWDDTAAAERFERLGGRLFRGQGRLVAPSTVRVGDQQLEASRGVVIATGASPTIPPIPGLADVEYWTSRDVIEMERAPSSLILLGGGAIGLELAQALARFGVRVTIVEMQDRIMYFEEPEVRDMLTRVLASEGIEVMTSTRVTGVRGGPGLITATLDNGSELSAERLLVATGRQARLGELGLEVAGIDGSQRAIPVDGNLRAAPGIWAVGDVTGIGAFTHVAVYQARVAIDDLLGRPHPEADYRALPRVTFTDPEIGSVGLTEAAARQQGLRVRTATDPLSASSRGFVHGPGNEGLIKLVEDADRGVLVGGTTAGPSGGEMIAMLSVAVAAEVPTDQLRHMIWSFPTFHRGIEGPLASLQEPAMASRS